MITLEYLNSTRTPKQRDLVNTYTTHACPTVAKFLTANLNNTLQLVTHGTKAGTMQEAGTVYRLACRTNEEPTVHLQVFMGGSVLATGFEIVATVSGVDVETEDFDPNKHLFYRYLNRLIEPSSLVQTIDGKYVMEERAVKLHPDYYDDSEYYHRDNAYWSDVYDEYILSDDCVECEITGYTVHRDDPEIEHTPQGWVLTGHDVVGWAEDAEEYMHTDYLRWCNDREAYYTEEGYYDYKSRSRINDYHCGVEPNFFLKQEGFGLDVYTIGFEVEKNDLYGVESGDVEEQPLFSHWERDSSCGVEGITNVYSLNNYGVFSDHVERSYYVNAMCDRRCGGHINIAHTENKMEMWHLKPWLGLMWAIWRFRLKNSYSNRNKKVNPYSGREYHYGVVVEKGRSGKKRFELRIPSRVHGDDCLRNRFRLMQSLMQCVDDYLHERFDRITLTKFIDKHNGIPNSVSGNVSNAANLKTFAELIALCPAPTFRRVRYLLDAALPTLQVMYKGQPDKLAEVVTYAYLFQYYIDTPNDTALPAEARAFINEFIND